MKRRDLFASIAMAAGLVVSYGTLAAQGLLFLLPKKTKPDTRKLFAGQINQFDVGGVNTLHDLEGNPILVRRLDESTFQAFDSTCPHLGCKVHWEEDKDRFLCPCHMGVFNKEGVAISGPPADGGQNLNEVPLIVDQESGVLYLEVKDIDRRHA